MSPVFSHGKLRLYLLSLLAERPRHGYEVIQALGERFGGSYVPSAGTVYPRLAKLNEEGLVEKTSEGRKTVYSITEAGQAELAAREGEIDEIETELDDSVRRLASEVRSSVRQAMQSLRVELASAAAAERTRPYAPSYGQSAPSPSDQWQTGATSRTDTQGSRAGADDVGRGSNTAQGRSAGHDRGGYGWGGAGTWPDSSSNRMDYSDPAQLRMLLREMEAQVNDFRQNVRARLRYAASRARLTGETAEQVRTELARASQKIHDILY